MKTFYIYGPDNIFTHEVEVEDGEAPPERSSEWRPNIDDEVMQDAFFDGFGWVIIRKVELIAPHVLVQAATMASEQEFQRSLSALTAGYSQFEVDTWDLQLAEAIAFDPETPSPFLAQLAAKRGQTVAELVVKIKEKSAQYRARYAEHVGNRLAGREIVEGEIEITPEMSWMPHLRG